MIMDEGKQRELSKSHPTLFLPILWDIRASELPCRQTALSIRVSGGLKQEAIAHKSLAT